MDKISVDEYEYMDVYVYIWGFPETLVVKNLPASTGDVRDVGSFPGSGRPPGGGQGKPLQCSFLEDPMGGEAWRAAASTAARSQTRLKRRSRHGCLLPCHIT